MIEFFGLIALLTIASIRCGFMWVLSVSGVWLAAMVYNPPIHTNVVWFIASVAAVITPDFAQSVKKAAGEIKEEDE